MYFHTGFEYLENIDMPTPVNKSAALDFFKIAKTEEYEILAPLERKTQRKIAIKNLTDILETGSNESHPKFQQLVGDFILFQAPFFQEVNQESEKYASEGYKRQGSRMAFHRPESIAKDFKQALEDPRNNIFLLVTDESSGDILGSVSLLQCENGLPELSNFYLAKEVRRDAGSDRIGLGKFIFSKMLFHAMTIGYDEVFLTSRRKGGFERALTLFALFGFEEITKKEEVDRLVRPEYQSPRTIAMSLKGIQNTLY